MIDAKQEIINRLIDNIDKRVGIALESSDIEEIVNILSNNQFVANSNIAKKELKEIIDRISSDLVRKDTTENSS